MKRIIITIICALGAVLANVAWSQDLATMVLDEALVFSAPDGDAVTIAAGSYFAELADNDEMRLVPPEGDAVLVRATRGQHDLEIDEPVVQMIDDDEIATHVVLVLPGGEFADAVGSRGGVLGRGHRQITIEELQAAMAKTSAAVVTRGRGPGPGIARFKPAKQSGTGFRGVASRAVDGKTDGIYKNGSVTHTDGKSNPWWEVDLGAKYDITGIEIWNRTDCCSSRLNNFYITVSNKSGGSGQRFFKGRQYYNRNQDPRIPLSFTGNRSGRFVRIQRIVTGDYLSLAEGDASLEALREILRLYNFSDSPVTAQRIRGIRAMACRPVVRRLGTEAWRGFCRGLEITLEFDEDLYEGSGAVVFAAVLSHFFALYTSVNSFTQLVMQSQEREGVVKRWPPMAGAQIVL